MREGLTVALGAQRYRVERPWGDLPATPGGISDVACDAAGRVYVQYRTDPMVDPPSPGVVVLSAEGARLAAWGESIADGHMLTVHPDGRVFVVDRDAQEVVIFAATGERLGGIGTRHGPGAPFNAPCDVAFAPDGTIYVADGYANARVHRFAPDGTPQGGWGAPGRGPGEFCTPHSVWVQPDGTVLVCDRDNSRVQAFSPAGAFLFEVTDVHKPMDVHGGPDGTFYVTDQVPRLSWFAGDGRLLGRCRPVLNGAHGMWRDPRSGVIYQSELNPNRLTRLVPL
ncbi:NHL repeat-containing protein [Paracraurococcus ruber]|uniref:Peptidase n=1 Tax=Paracraurococcus ruber TaxID=77675 RepID=A0ABS1CW30_9PROT|nr:peptidase [Paracraurococcus ruber]MBK1658157.1 peptidase [Paracraurococcus ruber]TDG28803.1 peptidase [Paracraurococcus ruber]